MFEVAARGFVVLGCLVVLGLNGCSSDASPGATTANDPTHPAMNGLVVEFPTLNKVGGATVTALGQSATTDTSGKFSLRLPANTIFAYSITAPDHIKYVSQEMMLNGEFNQDASFVTTSSSLPLLTGKLPDLDDKLGVVTVTVLPRGACADETAATLAADPLGSIKVSYADEAGLPSPTATSFAKNQYAVLYNVPLNVSLSVAVTHPTCHQAPFPYTDDKTTPQLGAVTYTGKGIMATEPVSLSTVTYANLFLQ
jgi:hypothetical protein